jgi:hypothetical protein
MVFAAIIERNEKHMMIDLLWNLCRIIWSFVCVLTGTACAFILVLTIAAMIRGAWK